MSNTRPIGITVLCSLIAISLGAVPTYLAYLFLTNQEASNLTGMNLSAFLLNASISIGIAVSSFFTWKGNIRAKQIMFSLIWIHAIGVVYNNISLLINPSLLGFDALNVEQKTKLFSNIVRAIMWLALIYWYFNTEKVKAFFSKATEISSPSSDT